MTYYQQPCKKKTKMQIDDHNVKQMFYLHIKTHIYIMIYFGKQFENSLPWFTLQVEKHCIIIKS